MATTSILSRPIQPNDNAKTEIPRAFVKDEKQHAATSIMHSIGRLLSHANYGNAEPTTITPEKRQALLKSMEERAAELGVNPYESPTFTKLFQAGHLMATLAYGSQNIPSLTYIGIMTWMFLVVDDLFPEHVPNFTYNFTQGTPQPVSFLEAFATHTRDAFKHWDPLVASMIQTSTLSFTTSTALERAPWFDQMGESLGGASKCFGNEMRRLSGMGFAFISFIFPKDLYPDTGAFWGALPSLEWMCCFGNDIMSFYKEEMAGETNNYVHLMARAHGRNVLDELDAITTITIQHIEDINNALVGNQEVFKAWRRFLYGYLDFHVRTSRYRLKELGYESK